MTSAKISNTEPMVVLGIESSCDETGLAIYHEHKGFIGDVVHSQVDIHQEYGGVVPELASREHISRIYHLLQQVLEQAGIRLADITGIACTAGPGLAGALLVGRSFGHSLAMALEVPVIGIHHMEGHLLAPVAVSDIEFPFVALLVSGGHTMLVAAEAVGKYSILGQSIDDAAGEALDKTARLLDLPWPGGAKLAAMAEQGRPGQYQFPHPMKHHNTMNLSFSGLKTSALHKVKAMGADPSPQQRADLARGFLDAVIASLADRCEKAMRQTGYKCLVAGGGVAANTQLRQQLQGMAAELGVAVVFPEPRMCTDNGAMIAYAGYLRLSAGEHDDISFSVYPRWPLTDLAPPGSARSL